MQTATWYWSHVICQAEAKTGYDEWNLPLLGLSLEPLRLQRVIDDAARDAGYEELTKNQVDTIAAFLHSKDGFICLLIGSRKSICFVLLPQIVDALKAAVMQTK